MLKTSLLFPRIDIGTLLISIGYSRWLHNRWILLVGTHLEFYRLYADRDLELGLEMEVVADLSRCLQLSMVALSLVLLAFASDPGINRIALVNRLGPIERYLR